MRIGIFGRGRLGSAIAEAARAAGDVVAFAAGRDAGTLPEADVAVDASAAEAVRGHLLWAIDRGVPLVIGTTGFDATDLEALVRDRIGVVVAPNFSLSVALLTRLSRLLARYADVAGGFEPYLAEHHHGRKRDAPSGTARHLAQAILAAYPRKTRWEMPGPAGPLDPAALCVGVLRAGSTYSSHTVGIDGPGEVIEIRHESRSAAVYATGALAACRWIEGRRGVHPMEAVTRGILDPIFAEEAP